MRNLHLKIYRNLLLVSCLLSLASGPQALAHHSFAVHFVPDKLVTVEGVVQEFRFTNPHGVLLFTEIREDGTEIEWRAETNSPNALRRRGWAADSFKPGDKITITGFPARDQEHYMRISSVVFEDGHELHAQAKTD